MAVVSQRRRRDQKKKGMNLNIISLIDIFTVLVFFLLLNLTEQEKLPESKDVHLPESVAQVPARDSVIVMLNREQILVQGALVATIDDVLKSTEPTIPRLRDALARIPPSAVPATPAVSAGRATPASPAEAPPPRELTIMGDRDISYSLLRKVLATCADSDFGSISLAVQQKDVPASMMPVAGLAR